jgi:hypothetical protein
MKIKPSRAALNLLLTIIICFLMQGCRDEGTTVWSADTFSPDRQWVANASAKQWRGGLGTAFAATIVNLKRPDGSKPSIEILEFEDDGTYPSGTATVDMAWLTPTHLEVTYKGHATIDFQVVKCAGIDISVRDLSTEAIHIQVKP